MKIRFILVSFLMTPFFSYNAETQEALPQLETPECSRVDVQTLVKRAAKVVASSVQSKESLTSTNRYALVHKLCQAQALTIDKERFPIIAFNISSLVKKELGMNF